MVKKFSAILVILILLSCTSIQQSLWGPDYGPHVEVIVPSYKDFIGWYPSPSGDKIIYAVGDNSNRSSYIFFTNTKEHQKLETCDRRWLDDTSILCLDKLIVIWISNTNKLVQLPVNPINDTNTITKTYKISKNMVITKLSGNPPEYFYMEEVTGSQHTDEVQSSVYDLKEYAKTIYSPNYKYYYKLEPDHKGQDMLIIYDATADKKLIEFVTGQGDVIDGSYWASDSSGVYFSTMHLWAMGEMFANERRELLKLNVP